MSTVQEHGWDVAEPAGARLDPAYENERLAALYDVLNKWTPHDDEDEMAAFYLGYLMPAGSVLDVGCGTGELLCRARRAGHRGDLVGLDPAPGMLAVARGKRDDIRWLRGRAERLDVGRTFELVTMTGHAFQELTDDDVTTAALRGFHRHLEPGGRLVFETRNPAARVWEHWTAARTLTTVRSPRGQAFDVSYDVRAVREPDLVDYVAAFRSWVTGETVESPGTIRFPAPDHVGALLAAAGFRVDATYGDWDGSAVAPSRPEVVFVATRL